MQLKTKEHYDLMHAFERVFGQAPHYMRLDKETKDQWAKGYIYQSAETNALFKAFRHGAAFALSAAIT